MKRNARPVIKLLKKLSVIKRSSATTVEEAVQDLIDALETSMLSPQHSSIGDLQIESLESTLKAATFDDIMKPWNS